MLFLLFLEGRAPRSATRARLWRRLAGQRALGLRQPDCGKLERHWDGRLRLGGHHDRPVVDGGRSEGRSRLDDGRRVRPHAAREKTPHKVTASGAKVTFTVRCADGSTPSQSTWTVPFPSATYTVQKTGWVGGGSSATVPAFCGAAKVRFDKGAPSAPRSSRIRS